MIERRKGKERRDTMPDNVHREEANLQREEANTQREESNLGRENENTQREEKLTNEEPVSIHKIMEGSSERLDVLRKIVSHLASDEKEAAARVASAVALANTLHDEVVVSTDITGTIVFTNTPVEALLGYAPEELVGQPLTTIVPERLREQHVAGFFRYIETGEKAFPSWRDMPIIALRKDGTEVNVSISFEDVPILGQRMIVGVLRKLDAAKQTTTGHTDGG